MARIDQFLSPGGKRPPVAWRKHHGDVLAYSMWRIVQHLFDAQHDERAFSTIDRGIALGLHHREPRFALLACDRLIELGRVEEAFDAARGVLAGRTTDPAYADLADWVVFTGNTLFAEEPAPRVITHPRRARPDGLSNPRLYS